MECAIEKYWTNLYYLVVMVFCCAWCIFIVCNFSAFTTFHIWYYVFMKVWVVISIVFMFVSTKFALIKCSKVSTRLWKYFLDVHIYEIIDIKKHSLTESVRTANIKPMIEIDRSIHDILYSRSVLAPRGGSIFLLNIL